MRAGGPDALAPCPERPNCVSSQASDAAQRVAPLALGSDPDAGWERLRAAVAALPRTRIVEATPDRIQAEVRSALFGFVDDVTLVRDAARGVADVRSASRTGYWDLGVNRRRVEALRRSLAEGAVR